MSSSIPEISFAQYTNKSFLVRCDRDRFHKVITRELKGRWNPTIKSGPAFQVPIESKDKLLKLIQYVMVNGSNTLPYKLDDETINISDIQSIQRNMIQSIHPYMSIAMNNAMSSVSRTETITKNEKTTSTLTLSEYLNYHHLYKEIFETKLLLFIKN